MNITFTEHELRVLKFAMLTQIKNRFSYRHCFRRAVGSLPARPEYVAAHYREIRELCALARRLELARERTIDRIYRRPRCRDMAELRRRHAEYKTRERIRIDAANLKFAPLQHAA